MKILITNDDGYQSKGIQALIDACMPLGDITVIAPDGARSGQASAISVAVPLRLRKIEERSQEHVAFYACTGTPADCVKLALNVVFQGEKPDLVVSGINHGSNASINVIYSGTMGACMVAAENGIPAIGFSYCDHRADADFTTTVQHVPAIIRAILAKQKEVPYGVCFNVNVPVGAIRGIRMTRQCEANWQKEYVEYKDPTGASFYMLTGEFVNHEAEAEDTDEWALAHGYIAITPTTIDMTAQWKGSIDIG